MQMSSHYILTHGFLPKRRESKCENIFYFAQEFKKNTSFSEFSFEVFWETNDFHCPENIFCFKFLKRRFVRFENCFFSLISVNSRWYLKKFEKWWIYNVMMVSFSFDKCTFILSSKGFSKQMNKVKNMRTMKSWKFIW